MANQHHPDRAPIYVRFHKDFVAQVKAAAAANGEALQDYVERALRAQMSRESALTDSSDTASSETVAQ